MRTLIFGATGMLGQALMRQAQARGLDVIGSARSGGDMAVDMMDAAALKAAVAEVAPDVIINAAALTDHDASEHDIAGTYSINARAVALLADAARAKGIRLVQISTDQFWTGDGALAHDEDHPISMLPGEYVRTKLAGEVFALTAPNALVVRTNITGLRGTPGRPTFIEWVFSEVEQGRPFRLFDDYFGSTIDTGAFADISFDLIASDAAGRFNLASRTVSSKQDFILAAARKLTGVDPDYTSTSVAELATARAESAGLDVSKIEKHLGRPMPDRDQVVSALAAAWAKRDTSPRR